MEMKTAGNQMWKKVIYSSGPDGWVSAWLANDILPSHFVAEAWQHCGHLFYLQRSPMQRSKQKMHALVAAGMHTLIADVRSWHCQDFRFGPSVMIISPQIIYQISQVFAGICLFRGCKTYKGGKMQGGYWLSNELNSTVTTEMTHGWRKEVPAIWCRFVPAINPA